MSSRTLSLDLRERVVAAVLDGLSRRQAAARFGVSPASAVRWCALSATTGSAAARPRGGDRLSHRIEAQAGRIHALIAGKDDLTLARIRAHLADDGHHFAIGTLWRFSPVISLHGKKTAHAAEQERPDILTRRQDWFDTQPDLRPCDIIIMDNVSSHKGPGVQAAIEAAGATVRYLLPYSPDFNPIEKAFSKLKA